MFGHPVSLNYKNEPTYKSTFGGFMTFLVRGLILAYFFVNVVAVVDKSESSQIITNQKRNLSFDTTSFNLTRDIFDMGLFVSYFGTEDGV